MFKKQPKIDVKPTKLDKKLIFIGWGIIAVNFLVVLLFYPNLPETIPTHFNLKGEVDGFGQKSEIWTLPFLCLLLYFGINLLLKKIKPYQMNYPVRVTEKNAPELYAMSFRMLSLLSLGITIIFLLISINAILIAKKYFTSGLALTIPLIAILVITPFYFIYKMFKLPKK